MKQVHLIPGKTFAFKSKVKAGATLNLADCEVHLPYDSVWYLVDQRSFELSFNLGRLVGFFTR